jgi:hypothetical protein
MLLPSKWLPLCCSLTTTQHAPYAAPANRGNTALHANRTASDFQRQCCCLANRGSLCMLHCRLPLCCADVACRKTACRELPAVCARRKSCLPFLPAESAEKEPCLLTDPALYTAAAWPRLYCRLTGPVQPITAWRLLASAAAAQPIRPLLLCTCKQLERYTLPCRSC